MTKRTLILSVLLLSGLAHSAPTVTLTSPGAGWQYNAPAASVPLRASVTAETGTTISKVEFLANGQLLYTDTKTAYAWNWPNVPAGSYTVTARVTDSQNQVVESAGQLLTVSASNQPPKVSLSAPANNSTYAQPAEIVVSASASDIEKNGKVAQVEFFANGVSLGVVTATPYQVTWSNPAASVYTLTALATDNLGGQTTSTARTVTVSATNAAPKVSLSGLTNNGKYLAPVELPLTLSASDVDANTPVTKVDLLVNGEVVQSWTQKPYTYLWKPVAGSYTVSAQATDNRGILGTATAKTVTLGDNLPPTVSLTAPANKALIVGTTVTLTANAAAPEVNDTVAQVDFYQGTTLIGTATQKPYTVTWNNVQPGAYTLTAKATDGQGASTASPARTITVVANKLPTVSLTSPTENQRFTEGSDVSLTATATDTDGGIAKVEFYQGTTLIGSATQTPYAATWKQVKAGSYNLTAKATDKNGGESFSAAVQIQVGRPTQVYFLHSDHLGTPRLVTDQQNTVVWRSLPTTEPFGNNPPETDPNNSGQAFEFNLRFPGQYADRETNLVDNWFRTYDPATGSYRQSDPLGLKAGINTYTYVNGNPLSGIDPLGLMGQKPPAGIPGMGSITNPEGKGAPGAAGQMLNKLLLSGPVYSTALSCSSSVSCAFYRSRGDDVLLERCIQYVTDNPAIPLQEKGGAIGACTSGCRQLMQEKCKNNPNACLATDNGNDTN